jgi:hypothetical protein
MNALGSSMKGYPINTVTLNTASTITLGNQVHIVFAITVPKDATLTGVRFFQNVTGVYTASNYNGIGLFSLSGTTLTLVAFTTNDGNIWKGSFGMNSKAFSSPYVATRGTYYLGIVYSQSAQTTGPVLYSNNSNTAVSTYDFTSPNKICGTVGSTTALPSTLAMSAVTNAANIPYIYPY